MMNQAEYSMTGSSRTDPLLVFRTARLAACSGLTPDSETLALCRSMDVQQLTGAAVEVELQTALLQAERPSVFFAVLRETDHLKEWFPIVQRLCGVPQNPAYHPEGDVWTHTMMTVDAAAKRQNRVRYPYGYMLSALAHDFGKILTTELKDGVYHSYCHEYEGLSLIHPFLAPLTDDKALHRYVRNMVKLHMKPSAMAIGHAKIKSTNHLFDEAIAPEDLIQLAAADCYGIGGERDYSANEQFLTERLAIYYETMRQPFVGREDLLAMGIPEGELFQKLLLYAHKMRLAQVSRQDALKQVLAAAGRR